MEHLWGSFTEELPSAVINNQGLDLGATEKQFLKGVREFAVDKEEDTISQNPVTEEVIVKILQAGGGSTNQERTLAPRKAKTREALVKTP